MGFLDDAIGFAKKAVPTVQRAIGKLKGASGSAADYFLKLEGVEGESQAEGHKGEIEIVGFSIANAQVGSAASGGGAGTGKVQFEDMVLTAKINKASPTLMLACAQGRHFAKAVFTARKAGEGQQDYLTITMTDLIITGYQLQDVGDADPVPVEVYSLNFATIEFQYKEQKPDGSLGAAVKTAFDLKKMIKK